MTTAGCFNCTTAGGFTDIVSYSGYTFDGVTMSSGVTDASGNATVSLGTMARNNVNYSQSPTGSDFVLQFAFLMPLGIGGGADELIATIAGSQGQPGDLDFDNAFKTYTFTNEFGTGSFEDLDHFPVAPRARESERGLPRPVGEVDVRGKQRVRPFQAVVHRHRVALGVGDGEHVDARHGLAGIQEILPPEGEIRGPEVRGEVERAAVGPGHGDGLDRPGDLAVGIVHCMFRKRCGSANSGRVSAHAERTE
jgi:hypothetical protein